VKNTKWRRARVKNGDAQIARLHHRVLYYRVIRNMRPGASLIRIHLRCMLVSARLPLKDTYETRFKGVRHRFDWRRGSLWH
jgi:hypothetical protein